MNLNNLIFPAPSSSYTSTSLNNLIWVPRSRFFSMKTLMKDKTTLEQVERRYKEKISSQSLNRIPCHFQKYTEDCKNLILYFHGNGEDLGLGETFVKKLSVGLKANVLSVEYPGYGIYEGESCAETILEDAEIVFDFLTTELKLSSDNIILLGRSIGSAAAIHLAACRKAKMLVVMSAFTSIKDVVKNVSGSLMSHFVADRFLNVEMIQKVECPVCFIHGEKDRLVPVEHSETLLRHCKSITKTHFPKNMTHNEFSVNADVIQPIRMFCYEVGFVMDYGTLKLPDYVSLAPTIAYESKRGFLGKIVDQMIIKC